MMLTPETSQLLLPAERKLVTDLGAAIEIPRISGLPAYRPDLQHHNEGHIYEETLPEGMRLLRRDGAQNTSHNRLIVAAGIQTHDMFSHLALDPDEFRTKEERSAVIAGPILLEFFSREDTEEVQGTILGTSALYPCDTPNQRKVRRADISNVGSRTRVPFLATTVRLYQEEIKLSLEAGREPLLWAPFIKRQYDVLAGLLEQDLSLGTERLRNGVGPFNRWGWRNARLLDSKHAVRDPDLFVDRYKGHLRPLVVGFDETAACIRRRPGAQA